MESVKGVPEPYWWSCGATWDEKGWEMLSSGNIRCGKNRALFLQGWRQFKDICNRLNDSLIIRSHGFSPPSALTHSSVYELCDCYRQLAPGATPTAAHNDPGCCHVYMCVYVWGKEWMMRWACLVEQAEERGTLVSSQA